MKGKGWIVAMDFVLCVLNATIGIAFLGSVPVWTTALSLMTTGACFGFGLFLIFVERGTVWCS